MKRQVTTTLVAIALMSCLATACAQPDDVVARTGSIVLPSGCQDQIRPDQISVHVDQNFGGTCAILGINDDVGFGAGVFPRSMDIGLPNDTITSFALGAEVQAKLFENESFNSFGPTFTSSRANIGSVYNDKTSAILIERLGENCHPIDPGQVCFFENENFNGFTFVGGREVSVGTYNDSSFMGIGTNRISSIRVGNGVVARVCTNTFLTGTCSDLAPADFGPASSIPVGNDTISSFQILGSCRLADGGNSCSELSPSGVCFCDAACAQSGDCCFDKFSVCGP